MIAETFEKIAGGAQVPPGFFASAESGANRLVKGSKSPTRIYDRFNVDTGEQIGEFEQGDRVHDVRAPGTIARLLHRAWSGEWRIRLENELPHGLPPEQEGERITRALSWRGANAIGDSCEYVGREFGGYTTFLTLTLSGSKKAEKVGEGAAGDRVSGIEAEGPFSRVVFWSIRDRINSRRAVPDDRAIKVAHPAGRVLGELASYGKELGEGPGQRVAWRYAEPGRTGDKVGKVHAAGPFCRVSEKTAKSHAGHAGEICAGVEASGPFCRVRFDWQSSIQREAGRFFDALSKMYARGWVPAYRRERREECDGAPYTPITWNREGRKLGGPDVGPVDRLLYCWVAENPTNEAGERNPHIHVLIKWAVPFEFFPCWAKRIESLWGQGFAHLEKLKERKAGAYYMAKAAGYLSKASGESDQGPIRGNRYGMATAARAPGWVPVLAWAWGILGHLMKEARERAAALVSPLRKTREKAKEQLQQAKPRTGAKQRAARLLMKARDAIKAVPVVSRWAVTFNGDGPLDRFVQWAERQGWSGDKRPDRMWLGKWKQQRQDREKRREFWRRFEWDQALDAMREWFSRWEPVFSGYRDEDQQWERVCYG